MKRLIKMTTTMLLVLGLFSGAMGALAQTSTDGVDLSPNPDQCNQAPRTIAEVEALLEAGIPASTANLVATGDFVLPAGEEAPSEVRGGIVETIVQIIACANGGDAGARLERRTG